MSFRICKSWDTMNDVWHFLYNNLFDSKCRIFWYIKVFNFWKFNKLPIKNLKHNYPQKSSKGKKHATAKSHFYLWPALNCHSLVLDSHRSWRKSACVRYSIFASLSFLLNFATQRCSVKSFSWKIGKIHRKTLVSEPLF